MSIGRSVRRHCHIQSDTNSDTFSLLDEPFTGVVYLKESGITSDFRTLKGKRIGYVGEFGKIQIDELVSTSFTLST